MSRIHLLENNIIFKKQIIQPLFLPFHLEK